MSAVPYNSALMDADLKQILYGPFTLGWGETFICCILIRDECSINILSCVSIKQPINQIEETLIKNNLIGKELNC